jgi:hypothetical protein
VVLTLAICVVYAQSQQCHANLFSFTFPIMSYTNTNIRPPRLSIKKRVLFMQFLHRPNLLRCSSYSVAVPCQKKTYNTEWDCHPPPRVSCVASLSCTALRMYKDVRLHGVRVLLPSTVQLSVKACRPWKGWSTPHLGVKAVTPQSLEPSRAGVP